ncbi:MAG TPA: metallophosphoesterase [Paracoccus sp. (in: a-proteobacteria)]|uniref:metallophosphoesterase n=1 Tax=Paracoccus sp. TaxID=267 RepID=UPI002C913E57|nr:metallophosphoesterase [Paracoccus sp. (in: a-proteobacteria)]HWL56817.1 metallophosphoesterase [Paracoccus sp. (in: a-proteobacteria)]
MHWFTADPHYSHDRIIGFCDRPFPDVAAMIAQLLAECRSRVGPDNDLWILGDFTAGRSTDAQRREVRGIYHALPGRKHLIRGNHDEDWVCDLPWDSVAETADIVVDKRRLFLCHYPMITWPGARHQGLQLFGHVHQNWQGSRNSVNVGADVWNFRPVTLPEIERRAAKLPVNPLRDRVGPGSSCCARAAVGSSTRPWSRGRPWCATGGLSWPRRTRRSSFWGRPCANGCRGPACLPGMHRRLSLCQGGHAAGRIHLRRDAEPGRS